MDTDETRITAEIKSCLLSSSVFHPCPSVAPLLGSPMLRLFSALALTLALALPATAGPPNVLFIVGDDQGWADYGFMGHEQIKTPHIDKLARESLVFKRGYV